MWVIDDIFSSSQKRGEPPWCRSPWCDWILERFFLLAAPNLNISWNIYFKNITKQKKKTCPFNFTIHSFGVDIELFFRLWPALWPNQGSIPLKCGLKEIAALNAQGPRGLTAVAALFWVVKWLHIKIWGAYFPLGQCQHRWPNIPGAVCFFMTVPPLLPSQSSVHTLLVPVCKVQWRNCLSEGQETLAVTLGLPQACAYMFMSTIHTCTLHIYMWGEKEKKKKKIHLEGQRWTQRTRGKMK